MEDDGSNESDEMVESQIKRHVFASDIVDNGIVV